MIWRALSALLALVAILAMIPAIRHLRETPPPPDPPIVLALTPPPGTELGSAADLALDLAIAPSEREVVFAASRDGAVQLWRRALDSAGAEPIAGTTGASMPAYSGDGTTVWHFAERKLRTVNVRGGEVTDRGDAPAPAGLSVRDDAVLFAPAPGPIKQLADGRVSDATTLRAGERSHAFPSWIGNGNAFVYLATHEDGRRTLRVRDDDGDAELARADSHAVVVEDHLVFVRDGALRAEPIDLESRQLRPPTRTLAIDVGVSSLGQGAFALSERLLVTAPPVQRLAQLQWFTSSGEAQASVMEPGDYWQLRLSPDQRTVAVTVRDPLLRTFDVVTVPASSGYPTRVTLAVASDSDPVWSPDGRRIAFRSLQEIQPHIFTTPSSRVTAESASRPAPDQPLLRSPLDEVPTEWTNAGLLFHARSPGTGVDVWFLPTGAATATAVFKSTFDEVDARLSPDGRWVAYASDESGQFEIYVARRSDGGSRIRVSTAGGTKPQWTEGGRVIVFRRSDDLMRVTIREEATGLATTIPARLLTLPAVRDAAVTGDGRRVLAIVAGPQPGASLPRVMVGWNVPPRASSRPGR